MGHAQQDYLVEVRVEQRRYYRVSGKWSATEAAQMTVEQVLAEGVPDKVLRDETYVQGAKLARERGVHAASGCMDELLLKRAEARAPEELDRRSAA